MKQNNIKIAITGGIGSGKSTVASIISDMGYPMYSCDKIYENLLTDLELIRSVTEEFGDVLTQGCIDKNKIAVSVFADERKLKKLNEITHPIIMRKVIDLMSCHEISFCEVPLLFEGGYEKLFDYVIVVLRDMEDRIQSVAERDKLSTESVLNRIKTQLDYSNSDFAQYYAIHNTANINVLVEKTREILNKISVCIGRRL